jgi:hypothetical protein
LRRNCPREIGHRLGRGLAGNQRLEHQHPGHPEHIAGHAGQLDVGRLQQLQQPIALSRLAFDELAAVAHQLAQLAKRLGRNKALRDQAVPDQVGDPFGILHVGLASGHVADVAGVPHDQIETALQHSIDRAPVDAGVLHPDLGHAQPGKPIPQLLQRSRMGGKGAHLLGRPSPGRADQNTRNHLS